MTSVQFSESKGLERIKNRSLIKYQANALKWKMAKNTQWVSSYYNDSFQDDDMNEQMLLQIADCNDSLKDVEKNEQTLLQ